MKNDQKIQLAVSQCLIGDNVRYNGESKKQDYVCDVLSRNFDLKPICPEVEIGLGVPRKPIQLVFTENRVRARQVENPDNDFTDALIAHAHSVAAQLQCVAGYVFKARSPSCGVNSTDVLDLSGKDVCESEISKKSSGIFAQVIQSLLPDLPIVDEIVFEDPLKKDLFLENVFCYVAYKKDPDNFIDNYGFRWSLRTGNSLNDIGLLSADDFKAAFFTDMNKEISQQVLVKNISGLMQARSAVFAELTANAQELINIQFREFRDKRLSYFEFYFRVVEILIKAGCLSQQNYPEALEIDLRKAK